eukprot:UN08341
MRANFLENDFYLDKVMDSWIVKHGKRPLLLIRRRLR